MSDTRVSVLTPPGTGAIATVSVVGPRAWELVRTKFRPAKGTLPEVPPLHRFWFGNLGDGPGDEVIAAVRQVEPEVAVEIHCHGGRRVVRWVVEQFGLPRDSGERDPLAVISRQTKDGRALDPLTRATTTRTAAVLLDQYHGSFTNAVEAILADLPYQQPALQRLAALAPLGRHLVEPWRVVIAGPPNVGKSSLLNALAGYQRSIVSPTAGTTRDVVGVDLAFDGWPVRMTDTAGLRATGETLEAAGIALAERELSTADLVVWVTDVTESQPVMPNFVPDLLVGNKSDLAPTAQFASPAIRVSAVTGVGLPELVAEIVRRVLPVQPEPGEAVPFTLALADRVERANAAVTAGNIDTARDLLRDCLPAV